MIRWGIIGCGDVTEVKSGPAFKWAEHSTLIAVMRRDGAKAADYAQRHHVPHSYDDADALIADPQVDAVYIATPPSSHMELALRVAAAGKPALVEKPMARNHRECLQMIEAFKSAGAPLFVAYYRRALPRFLKIKSLLEEGAIGTTLTVSVLHRLPPKRIDPQNLPWRLRPDISGGGLFVDLACHTLDLLDYYFGPMVKVQGFATRQVQGYDAEDCVVMSFVQDSGVLGCGTWDFNSRCAIDHVRIDGTAGTIEFSVFGQDTVVLRSEGRNVSFDLPNPRGVHQPFIQKVVDALSGGDVFPSTGESAARTSRVMDDVLRSFYNKPHEDSSASPVVD